MCLTYPKAYLFLHGPNHLQLKFYTIMQDFKRVWTLIARKRRIEQLNFSDWLSNVKNVVLSNGFEHVRNVIQWFKKLFFPKTYKNRSAAGGFAPKPP